MSPRTAKYIEALTHQHGVRVLARFIQRCRTSATYVDTPLIVIL
jgi:hypothetical protein